MNLLGIPIETNDSLQPGTFAIVGQPTNTYIVQRLDGGTEIHSEFEAVYAGYHWRIKRIERDLKIESDGTEVRATLQFRHEILSYEKLEGATE